MLPAHTANASTKVAMNLAAVEIKAFLPAIDFERSK